MARARHLSGGVSRGSHTGGAMTDFRSPAGAVITNPVWGTNVTSDDGTLGLVTALEITPGSVGVGDILPEAVPSSTIEPGSITGVMIGSDTITAANIAANTITAAEMGVDSISAWNIQAGTITSDEISASTISTIEFNAANIAANSITATDIFGSTITGLSFIAGGGQGTQITVTDWYGNVIGYWNTSGLFVNDGKFYVQGLPLRVAYSNGQPFWDFEGRAARAVKGLVTLDYAGSITDYVMDYMTLNGALGVDSYHGRMYFRYNGSWHYSSQTAGFEIPNYETICPVCGDPLLPGEDLIGRGDRLRDDGSLHALYIHLKCAGKPTNQVVADQYEAVARHPDLDENTADKAKYVADLEALVKKATDAQKGK